jgi:predicted transcriptional regulator of viral defense system
MTYKEMLRGIAAYQHGYVTTRDAAEVGVPAVELRKIAARGGLCNIARGVYRFPDAPTTPTDPYIEAVLRVGPDAVVTGESALALLGLAHVEPRKIRIASPRRVRLTSPGIVEVIHRAIPDDEITAYDGVPSTKVWRALVDTVGIVMMDRLEVALAQARRRDLVTPAEAARVQRALKAQRKGTWGNRHERDAKT